MTMRNKSAVRERRDCATIPVKHQIRGVGEPGRWAAT